MKNTLLLNNLLSIKNNFKENKELDLALLEAMIEDTRKEISLEKITTPSEKKAFNKALSYLKKLKNGTRPVLGYVNKQKLNDGKEYYVFTDSITLYALKENKGLPLFEDLSKEELEKNNISETTSYPQVFRLVPDENDGTPVEIFDYDKLVKSMKANPEYIRSYDYKNQKWYVLKIRLDSDEYIMLDGYFLKQTYEMLASKDLKAYVYGKNRPVLLMNDNGDKALILPVHSKKGDLEGVVINKEKD